MISNIVKTAKKKIDYYWYENNMTSCYVIGIRGVGNEMVIPMWDVVRAGDSFRAKNGRRWSEVEAIEWAVKWAHKQSQYVDFEDVIETPKMLC